MLWKFCSTGATAVLKGGVTVRAHSRKNHFQSLKSFTWKTNKNSTADRLLEARNIVYNKNFIVLRQKLWSEIDFSKILVLREWALTVTPPLN